MAGATGWPQRRQTTSPTPGEEQAEVFVDLGDGADRAPAEGSDSRPATAMAGGMPSIRSASGFSSGSRNCRA